MTTAGPEEHAFVEAHVAASMSTTQKIFAHGFSSIEKHKNRQGMWYARLPQSQGGRRIPGGPWDGKEAAVRARGSYLWRLQQRQPQGQQPVQQPEGQPERQPERQPQPQQQQQQPQEQPQQQQQSLRRRFTRTPSRTSSMASSTRTTSLPDSSITFAVRINPCPPPPFLPPPHPPTPPSPVSLP